MKSNLSSNGRKTIGKTNSTVSRPWLHFSCRGRATASPLCHSNLSVFGIAGGYCPTILVIFALTFTLFASAAARPNVLLIVSEDNGQELSCYSEPSVRTPNLDRLAEEGVLFKNAYVAQAGCSQSRASFLTGLYPHQNGQIGLATWKFRMYDENTPNLSRSFKETGYRTGIIGKLHVNPESAFRFDFEAIGSSNFKRNDLEGYAREAGKFINAGDKPFFLSINYPDAHRPFIPQVDGIPKNPLTGNDVKPLDYFGIDNPELRQQTADHYNCMIRLDTLIGDLLQVLKESGKAEDTIVVYIGDHGADMLRGKRTSYEGGTRIPFIVRWPGQTKTNLVNTNLVSLIDLAPTVLEATGTTPMPNLPGLSLIPLLKGEKTNWRTHLFTEFHIHSAHNYYPQRTVQNDRYKLILNLMPGIENPGYKFTNDRFFDNLMDTIDQAPESIRSAYYKMEKPAKFELYDLQDDPHEFNNLANDPKHSRILADLQERLQTWREETQDPMLDYNKVLKLKAEIDACFVDGQPDKAKLTLNYTDYFFE